MEDERAKREQVLLSVLGGVSAERLQRLAEDMQAWFTEQGYEITWTALDQIEALISVKYQEVFPSQGKG